MYRQLTLCLATALLASCSRFESKPDVEALPIIGVKHVGMTVSDIDETVAFYSQAGEFEIVSRYELSTDLFDPSLMSTDASTVEVALVRTPSVFIKMFDFDPGNPTTPADLPVYGPGYTHICYVSSVEDPSYEKFTTAGISMISRGDEPVDLGGWGVWYAYGRDPNGTMLEMEMHTRVLRDDPLWLHHIGMTAHELEPMTAFYETLLGYTPYRITDAHSNPMYDEVADLDDIRLKGSWFATWNLLIEIWEYENPRTPPRAAPAVLDALGYNSVAFEVNDLDEQVSRLSEAGVSFVGEPIVESGWKIAYAYDPAGNLISLQENVSAAASESIDELLWMNPERVRAIYKRIGEQRAREAAKREREAREQQE